MASERRQRHRSALVAAMSAASRGRHAAPRRYRHTGIRAGGERRAVRQHPGTIGRRRLGKLEVSSVGLGVQNMSRKYETTVPYRPEMINIIRTAYDKLIRQWAERKSATPAQIALAWLMAQKPWIVPIPGTTQMAHMLENIGATDVRFTPSELAELNAAVSAIQIRGARLPDQVLAFSGVEAPAQK